MSATVVDRTATRTTRLGAIAEFRNGVNYNSSSFGSGIKVVGVSNFQDFLKPRYSELAEINPEGVVTERSLLRHGDIVFVRSNGNRELIGRSLYVDSPPERLTHSAFTIRVRFLTPEADPLYFAYCFRGPLIRQALSAHGGGTNISNLNQDILGALEIPFPPLAEQRRIAGILSAYDDLIENCQRRIRILEEMARRLYREWFVHFRYPGHESVPLVNSPLGPIPQGWEVVAFTDIADVLSGGTPRTENPDFWNGDIPFFTPKDAPSCFYVAETEKHVTPAGLAKCASDHYPPDTVFITARGTVGKVTLPAVPMAMNQSCYALRGKPGTPQHFLFLLTLEQVAYLQKNTGGATFDTIVVDTFRRMQVVRSSQPVVDRFAQLVAPIFEQVRSLQATSSNLRRTRDLLLPRLLGGSIG